MTMTMADNGDFDLEEDCGPCVECGGRTVLQPYEHTTKIGDRTYRDDRFSRPTCVKCGEVTLTLKDMAGYECRAGIQALMVETTGLDPAPLRYARKVLGMTRDELDRALGTETMGVTVEGWEEEGDTVGLRCAQLAMVGLLHVFDLERFLKTADIR